MIRTSSIVLYYTYSTTVEPLLQDPPRKGQPLHISNSVLLYGVNIFSTSDKRTASLQGTKQLAPMCPLVGGSTVVSFLHHWQLCLYHIAGLFCVDLIRAHVQKRKN